MFKEYYRFVIFSNVR